MIKGNCAIWHCRDERQICPAEEWRFCTITQTALFLGVSSEHYREYILCSMANSMQLDRPKKASIGINIVETPASSVITFGILVRPSTPLKPSTYSDEILVQESSSRSLYCQELRRGRLHQGYPILSAISRPDLSFSS